MDYEEPVVLKTFSSIAAADMVASRLKAFGIDCWIQADDAGGMLVPLQAAEGVRLLVPAHRVSEAKGLLERSTIIPSDSLLDELASRSLGRPEATTARGRLPVFPLVLAFIVGVVSTLAWQAAKRLGTHTYRRDTNGDGM